MKINYSVFSLLVLCQGFLAIDAQAMIVTNSFQVKENIIAQEVAPNINAADSYYTLGNIKAESGDFRGAIIAFSRAIELNPNYIGAYNNRGMAKYSLGNYRGAITDYNLALKLNASPTIIAFIYNNRGVATAEIGDRRGAIADYNRAIEQLN